MTRPRQLSAAFVRTVNRPGRYGDGRGGHGLSLLVKPTVTGRTSRTWAQRLKFNGRPFSMGLGAYPIVTLAEARAMALENRRAVSQGRDPRGGGIPTFEQATKTVIALHAKNWKNGSSEKSWRQTLRDFAFPKLGRKRVSQITTADVLACLVPIWNEKRVTASRVRHRIGAVMKWAVAKGYREDNPAGDAIAAALPRNGGRQKHHRALPHSEVAAALKEIRDADGWLGTRLCLELIVLTATRSGEARLARWDEFDLDAATWTVPEARMKAGREHRGLRWSRFLGQVVKADSIMEQEAPRWPGRDDDFTAEFKARVALEELQVPHGQAGGRTRAMETTWWVPNGG